MITVREAVEALQKAPVIAAVKARENAGIAAKSQVCVVFVLGGSILTMGGIMDELRAGNKLVFLHMDLIEGIGRDEAAVRFAAQTWKPDGIISTKAQLLKSAREQGLLCVQRIFMMDSTALHSGARLLQQSRPDFVEVMPGIMPKAIATIAQAGKPVIAGGMVTQRAEVEQALRAGAIAVSTSREELWNVT